MFSFLLPAVLNQYLTVTSKPRYVQNRLVCVPLYFTVYNRIKNVQKWAKCLCVHGCRDANSLCMSSQQSWRSLNYIINEAFSVEHICTVALFWRNGCLLFVGSFQTSKSDITKGMEFALQIFAKVSWFVMARMKQLAITHVDIPCLAHDWKLLNTCSSHPGCRCSCREL